MIHTFSDRLNKYRVEFNKSLGCTISSSLKGVPAFFAISVLTHPGQRVVTRIPNGVIHDIKIQPIRGKQIL